MVDAMTKATVNHHQCPESHKRRAAETIVRSRGLRDDLLQLWATLKLQRSPVSWNSQEKIQPCKGIKKHGQAALLRLSTACKRQVGWITVVDLSLLPTGPVILSVRVSPPVLLMRILTNGARFPTQQLTGAAA